MGKFIRQRTVYELVEGEDLPSVKAGEGDVIDILNAGGHTLCLSQDKSSPQYWNHVTTRLQRGDIICIVGEKMARAMTEIEEDNETKMRQFEVPPKGSEELEGVSVVKAFEEGSETGE